MKARKICRIISDETVSIHEMKILSDGSLEYISDKLPMCLDKTKPCLVLDEKTTSALHFYIENYAFVEDWCFVMNNGNVGWTLSKHLEIM